MCCDSQVLLPERSPSPFLAWACRRRLQRPETAGIAGLVSAWFILYLRKLLRFIQNATRVRKRWKKVCRSADAGVTRARRGQLYCRNAVRPYLHAKEQRWSQRIPRKGRSLYEAYAQMRQHAAARKRAQLRLVHDCK